MFCIVAQRNQQQGVTVKKSIISEHCYIFFMKNTIVPKRNLENNLSIIFAQSASIVQTLKRGEILYFKDEIIIVFSFKQKVVKLFYLLAVYPAVAFQNIRFWTKKQSNSA